MTKPIQDYYDADVAKLNAIAMKSAARAEELKVENTKLRELVCDAHACKTNDGCCEDCYCDEGCCPVEQRMQELGIEVD